MCVARSAQCVSDAELVFVLATGAEMDPYYMPRLHEFVANVTRSLPVDSGQVRVGVITYGATPLIDIALGHYTTADELIAALGNLTYHGTRYLAHCTPVHYTVSVWRMIFTARVVCCDCRFIDNLYFTTNGSTQCNSTEKNKQLN